MRIHYKRCSLCGCSDVAVYCECRDYVVTGETFAVYRCPVCLLEFTQSPPDESESGRYYSSENYIPHSDSVRSLTGRIYYIIRQIMLRRKRRLVKRETGKSGGALLDYGSGTGHFAAAMKKAGWNVTGLELNDKAREYSTKSLGIKAIRPDEINRLPSGSFDCITFWHVLEHLSDIKGIMAEVKRLLRPGGVGLIALPNNMSYDSMYYRNYWAAYDVPRHLWHFNPVSFTNFAARSGFEVKSMNRLPFDVFYISVLSGKYRGSRIAFFTGIIKGFVFFFLSLFDIARSSSIVYVVRNIEFSGNKNQE